MPQPLSSATKPPYGYSLGNGGYFPLVTVPGFAELTVKIISGWAQFESFVARAFVKMVGDGLTPAADIYLKVNTLAQRQAMRAAAQATLCQSDLELFSALEAVSRSAQKERDKIAHWIWGTTPALPQCVLAVSPSAMLTNNIEMQKWTNDQNRQFAVYSEMVDKYFESLDPADRPKFPKMPFPKWPQSAFDRLADQIYVYTLQDFEKINQKIQILTRLWLQFGMLVERRRQEPSTARDFMIDDLSKKILGERLVHEEIGRQRGQQGKQA